MREKADGAGLSGELLSNLQELVISVVATGPSTSRRVRDLFALAFPEFLRAKKNGGEGISAADFLISAEAAMLYSGAIVGGVRLLETTKLSQDIVGCAEFYNTDLGLEMRALLAEEAFFLKKQSLAEKESDKRLEAWLKSQAAKTKNHEPDLVPAK